METAGRFIEVKVNSGLQHVDRDHPGVDSGDP